MKNIVTSLFVIFISFSLKVSTKNVAFVALKPALNLLFKFAQSEENQPAEVENTNNKDSFIKDCENIRYESFKLSAKCKNDNGEIVKTNLNLNKCISNQDGELEWYENGSFGLSSMKCKLDEDIIKCLSLKLDSTWIESTAKLKDMIVNINGELKCPNVPINPMILLHERFPIMIDKKNFLKK